MSAKRAFGSIRKLPSGRFQVRYRTLDGKQHTGPTTFPTKKGAEACRVAAASPYMLADHLDMLLFAGGMSAGTRDTLVSVVGSIPASRARDRVEAALIIAAMSPDYVIQK